MEKNIGRDRKELRNRIRALLYEQRFDFNRTALRVFEYQRKYNPLYRKFTELLQTKSLEVERMEDIPCMPVDVFKNHRVYLPEENPEMIFQSSGTTGQTRSRHRIPSLNWYREVCMQSFKKHYGSVENYNWIGLLPNYLEQTHSSLIFMLSEFTKVSDSDCSGLFSHCNQDFFSCVERSVRSGRPTVLIGVSFALLDLAETGKFNCPDHWIVMETGGMKGRRKEMTRRELHRKLSGAFSIPVIHSEYGMTELQSQAYSKGDGRFLPGPLMAVYTREINDPLSVERPGRAGGVNVIDLANFDTLPFIATMDSGLMREDGSFEILGRLDGSEARGCNLMYFN